MAIAPQRAGIGIRRHFTTAGTHPYDEVVWERRDARITNYRDGSVAFEQLDVEVPASWSVNATNILAQKYFRGTPGTPERESSLRQVADRVVDTVTAWGIKDGYFVDDEEAEAFSAELKHLIIHQKAAFNSPVWFNIGVAGVPQQGSACFILAVDDTMDSILNWYTEEGVIFKGGSGAGVNLSRIRSSHEFLKGGGTASGPVSFMRGADASAGTIKSGGKTRRAAKMVILDVDHPDIEDFIWCKATEERKARVLRDAGFDMDLDGKDSISLQYQNANNSVRVTDEFMQAVIDGARLGPRDPGRQGDGAHRAGPRPVPPVRPGGVGVRRPRHAVRHHHQQVAHGLQHRPHQRLQPVLGVHAPRQLGVQPGQPQPDDVPPRRLVVRRRGLHRLRGGHLHGPGDHRGQRRLPDGQDRRELAALPRAGHRLRQHRRPAHGPGPALRLGPGSGLGRRHHRPHDRPRLRHLGPHRRPHGAVRRVTTRTWSR